MLLFMACDSEMPAETPSERVEVSFGALELKSESDINSLTLCVFRSDGSLDICVREQGSSLTASLLKGEMLSFYLIANAPESLTGAVAGERDLADTKVGLAMNSRSGLVMMGRGERRFDGPEAVHVALDRLVCKVSLGSLVPSFVGADYLHSAPVVLDRVYLINACGSVPLSMEPSSEVVFNPGARDADLPAPVADLLDCGPEVLLESPSALSLDLEFYCCPNPLEETMLVLELSIGGEKNYYPIPLPAMECNKEYRAEVVELLSWGSASPDVPVSRSSVDFSVNVLEWETVEKECVMY